MTDRVDVDLSEHLLLRRSDDAHNLRELIVVVPTSEERVAQDHLGHAEWGGGQVQGKVRSAPPASSGYDEPLGEDSHASRTPDIDARAVRPRSQEHVWRSVPERDHLSSHVRTDRASGQRLCDLGGPLTRSVVSMH